MTQLELLLDALMCCGWITTYTLVLIGTKIYKFPLISLSTQISIASVEIAVLISFIVNKYIFNYAYFAYLYWSVIEVMIIFISLKQRNFTKEQKYKYWVTLIVLIIIMSFILKIDKGMLYFTYLNTIVGMILWFYYTLEKNYPIKPFVVAIFIVKMIADILGAIVYYNSYNNLVRFMSVFLPCIDLPFIILYFYRYFNQEKYNIFYDRFEKYLPKIKLYVPEKKKSAYGKMNKKKMKK